MSVLLIRLNLYLGLHFLFNVCRSYVIHLALKDHIRFVELAFKKTEYALSNPILGVLCSLNSLCQCSLLAGCHFAFSALVAFVIPTRTAPYLWDEETSETYWIHIGHDTLSTFLNAVIAGFSFVNLVPALPKM
jgi:hypothetical protein